MLLEILKVLLCLSIQRENNLVRKWKWLNIFFSKMFLKVGASGTSEFI